MLEEELHGRVRDDGATHLGPHEIFDVLGDGGETEGVFAGALRQRKEEVCRIIKLHELPSLVDDEETAFLFGADDIPDVIENDVHGDGAELVLEVANVEDNHLIININIRLLGEDAREGAGGVFAETLSELGTGALHVEQCIIKIDNGGRGGLVGERVGSDAGASIGVDEGLVEIRLFIGSEGRNGLTVGSSDIAAEHEAEEAVEGDEISLESIICILSVDDLWQVEGVDADIGIEREADVGAADGVAELLIFILGVDNENLGANHHGAERLELDGEGLASAGLGEDDHVGVF